MLFGRSCLMNPDRHGAFTLLELLVVIAVMSLLLSLMLPALTQARYQANLVACMSNLRQMNLGVMSYAADADGLYPLRLGIWKNQWSALNAIKDHRRPTNDDRPRLKAYMDLKVLNCPLGPRPDLDVEMLDTQWIYGGYIMLWGIRYLDHPLRARVGDPLIDPAGREHRVLAGDADMCDPPQPWRTSLHPVPGYYPSTAGWNEWMIEGENARTQPIDLNFLYDDGSVRRLSQVVDPYPKPPSPGATTIPRFPPSYEVDNHFVVPEPD